MKPQGLPAPTSRTRRCWSLGSGYSWASADQALPVHQGSQKRQYYVRTPSGGHLDSRIILHEHTCHYCWGCHNIVFTQGRSSRGLFPWRVDGHLLPVSSYGRPSLPVCVLISSNEATGPTGSEPPS